MAINPSQGRSLVIIAFLTATLVSSTAADHRRPDSLALPLDTIDTQDRRWTMGEQQDLAPALVERLKPTSYLSRLYNKGDRQISLFIAYYAQQQAGETMHSPKVCLPGSGWDIVEQGTAEVQAGGRKHMVNRYKIHNSSLRMQVFYWYQNRIVSSPTSISGRCFW